MDDERSGQVHPATLRRQNAQPGGSGVGFRSGGRPVECHRHVPGDHGGPIAPVRSSVVLFPG